MPTLREIFNDEACLEILDFLIRVPNEHKVEKISEGTGRSMAGIYPKLKTLTRNGLLQKRKDGRESFYKVDSLFMPFLKDIVDNYEDIRGKQLMVI